MIAVFIVAKVVTFQISERQMDMKGITVEAGEGFGHEGSVEAIVGGNLFGDKIKEDGTVGNGEWSARLQTDFMLRWGDFVMGFFVLDATFFQHIDDFLPDHLANITGRGVKITKFV